MKRVSGYRSVLFMLACIALLISGCGGSQGVKIEGRIVRDGQPYTAAKDETPSLSFAGKNTKDEETIYPAKVNPDGSFVVDGPDGRGIPPGTYKILLSAGAEGSDPNSLAHIEKANQQFARVDNKECQVTGEPNQKITIDLTNGTIGK